MLTEMGMTVIVRRQFVVAWYGRRRPEVAEQVESIVADYF